MTPSFVNHVLVSHRSQTITGLAGVLEGGVARGLDVLGQGERPRVGALLDLHGVARDGALVRSSGLRGARLFHLSRRRGLRHQVLQTARAAVRGPLEMLVNSTSVSLHRGTTRPTRPQPSGR